MQNKKQYYSGYNFRYLGILLLSTLGIVSTVFSACTYLPESRTHLRLDTKITLHPDRSIEVQEYITAPKSTRDKEISLSFPPSMTAVMDIRFRPLALRNAIQDPSLELDQEHFLYDPLEKKLSWKHPASPYPLYYDLCYRYENQVSTPTDIAKLDFYCLEPTEKTQIREWNIEVYLPFAGNDFEKNDILAWLRGRSKVFMTAYADTQILLRQENIPSKEDNYFRLLFPLAFLTEKSINPQQITLFSLIEAEFQADQKKKEQARAVRDIWIWSLLLLMFFIFYSYNHWQKNIQKWGAPFEVKILTELPDIFRCAELGLLHRFGKSTIRDLVATIFQLAVEGYLRIQEYILYIKEGDAIHHVMDYRLILQSKPWDSLIAYEQTLMHALFREFSNNGRTIKLYEIHKYFHRNPNHYRSFCRQWHHSLRKRNIVRNFFDQGIRQQQKWLKRLGITVALLGFFFMQSILVFFQSWQYAVPLPTVISLSGVSLLILSYAFKKRNKSIELEYSKYQAYQSYLGQLESRFYSQPLPSISHWDASLPFVIVCNQEGDFLHQLQSLYARKESKEVFASHFYSSILTEEDSSRIFENTFAMIQHFITIFSYTFPCLP